MNNENYPVVGLVYEQEKRRDLIISDILNRLESYFSNSKIFADVSIEVSKKESPEESPLVRYLLFGKPMHQNDAKTLGEKPKVLLGRCSLKKLVTQYLQTKQTYALTIEIFNRTPDIFGVDKKLSLQEALGFYKKYHSQMKQT